MRPGGLAIGADGNLYVSSNGTDAVLRYDGRNGAFVDVFASGGGLKKPSALVFAARNLLPQRTEAAIRTHSGSRPAIQFPRVRECLR